MRVGTIICNHWAGDDNPTKYSIYIGTGSKNIKVIQVVKGKLNIGEYDKKRFFESGMYEEVGYCNGLDIIKADLKAMNKND